MAAEVSQAAQQLVSAPEADASGGSALRSALRSGKLMTGTVILAIFVVIAIIGPDLVRTNPSALSSAVLQGPSAAHWLGTTQTGQDIFAQLIDSTRISMLVGFVAAAIATVLSIIIGVAGGYAGGVVDELLSVLSNVFLVIPALPLVIVLAGYLPNKGSISVALVISITGWAWGARIIRAQTLSLRKRDYVEAARLSGEGFFRILFWEILPHEGAIIAASFLGTVVFAILTQAGIAFLGLSDVTAWSWGTMLYWAQADQALLLGAWWWFVPPGIAIGLVGTALALMNFGIDELINPRLRAAGIGTKAAARKLVRDSRRERNMLREEAVNSPRSSPRRRGRGSRSSR
jgi:peptide/nickel transport system permease protein